MEREISKYGTNFTESEMLLAVMNEDDNHVWTLLKDMLPGEQIHLALACQRLARMIRGT
jgi:hypothetical protein